MQGRLFVIAAPSGAGKTSLVTALVEKDPQLVVSISYTTRAPRPQDQDGVDYHFVDLSRFEEMIKKNEFLEYAKVFDHYYGTCQRWVMEKLEQDLDVILEIDWQGAQQIFQQFPQAISIFIVPPSMEILRQRILSRKQDARAVIEQRLAAAREEIAHHKEFQYLCVNDQFDQALADLGAIIHSHRLARGVQERRFRNLLEDLL